MHWTEPFKIILGSASPRRVELMTKAGYDFQQRILDIDESYPEATPLDFIAQFIAMKKSTGTDLEHNDLLVTADSIVIHNREIMGKPQDKDEAIKYLTTLSGDKHLVYTGVCLRTPYSKKSFTEVTEVTMHEMTEEEIHYYVDSGKAYDKAGAYGIQDWIGVNMVEEIKGSYTNVMGLPMAALYQHMKKLCLNNQTKVLERYA